MKNSIWVNSHYSLLDSCLTLAEHISNCCKNGQTWAALTDINTTRALYKFASLCQKQRISPIVGVELHTSEWHLLLIAVSNIGLKRIFTIISRVKWYQKNSSGLALKCQLGAQTDNEGIACFALDKNISVADKNTLTMTFKLLFFNNKKRFPDRISFARINSLHGQLPIDILTAIKNRKKGVISFFKNQKQQYQSTNLSFLTSDEFYNDSFAIESFIRTINVNVNELLCYSLSTPISDKSAKNKLIKLAKIGLQNRLKKIAKKDWYKYKAQLQHELTVVGDLKMAQYILVVADYCRFIQKQGRILGGPGRGSSVGSLICYALYITHVDPIVFQLSFERFLCPNQQKLPDIDIDIQSDLRSKLLEYLAQKYANYQSAQICTIAKINSKSALKLIVGVLHEKYIPENINVLIDELYNVLNIGWQKQANGQGGCSAEQVIASRNFQKLCGNKRPFHKFWEFVAFILPLLTDCPKYESIHAAGLIISPGDSLNEKIGTTTTVTNQIVTQFTMDDLAALCYPKFDVLGLHTLTIINNCLLNIFKYKHKVIKIYQIANTNSEEMMQVMKSLGCQPTFGLFQLESAKFEKLVHQFKPQSIQELAAVISLFRPGVARIRQQLLQRRKESQTKGINNDSPSGPTYGFLIYQEQISQLLAKNLKITLAEAEELRRQLQSKSVSATIKKNEFLKYVAKKGCDSKIAEITFTHVQRFAEYAYNKSHATGYAVICYWTAYLKYLYPFEFGLTLANYFGHQSYKMQKIITMLANAKLTVQPPTLFLSESSFVLKDGIIYCPWWSISELNCKTVEVLSQLTIPFNSCESFFTKCGTEISKEQYTILIKAGVLDSFVSNREALLKKLTHIYSWCQLKNKSLLFPEINSD